MQRRIFFALPAVLMATSKAAQSQTPPKSGTDQSDKAVRDAELTDIELDYQSAVAQARNIATSFDEEAERKLLNVIQGARKRIDTGGSTLSQISAGVVPELVLFQRNVTILILGVLEKGKTQEGKIVVKVESVYEALKQYCPFFPFC